MKWIKDYFREYKFLLFLMAGFLTLQILFIMFLVFIVPGLPASWQTVIASNLNAFAKFTGPLILPAFRILISIFIGLLIAVIMVAIIEMLLIIILKTDPKKWSLGLRILLLTVSIVLTYFIVNIGPTQSLAIWGAKLFTS